ncbi:hypothetical protein JB92DRAFT_2919048 [Gautieria morchelliformis]|nr:hypothetical protein JB92DRAFT_2919048 [Gautieria morchelliformis]
MTKRTSSFDCKVHKTVQEAIRTAILETDYQPPRPELDVKTLDNALNWTEANKPRNKSIEWIGDSLMYAVISLELYREQQASKLNPWGNLSIISTVRARLVSNKTLALLTHKLNWSPHPYVSHKQKPGASKLAPYSKIYANIFEVVAAEVYLYTDRL